MQKSCGQWPAWARLIFDILSLNFAPFTRFELSQSRNMVLKQHFTLSCIYYSVIPSKIFSSVFAHKILNSYQFWVWVSKNKVQQSLWTAEFFQKNIDSIITIAIKLNLAKCKRSIYCEFHARKSDLLAL